MAGTWLLFSFTDCFRCGVGVVKAPVMSRVVVEDAGAQSPVTICRDPRTCHACIMQVRHRDVAATSSLKHCFLPLPHTHTNSCHGDKTNLHIPRHITASKANSIYSEINRKEREKDRDT